MNLIKRLDVNDIGEISESVKFRQEKFAENLTMSIGIVLMNYGDHLIKVRCVSGEWEGNKSDLLSRDGIPLCPNGHPLVEISKAPFIALIDD